MNDKLKRCYERYMYLVGVLGQMVFYAQAHTIFYNKSATDVSLLGFLTGFISVASWLFYGVLINNQPLIIANVIATIGAMLVLIGIFFYA